MCRVRVGLMGLVKNCHPHLRLRSKFFGKTDLARKNDTLQRLYKLLEKGLLLDDNAIEDRQPTRNEVGVMLSRGPYYYTS